MFLMKPKINDPVQTANSSSYFFIPPMRIIICGPSGSGKTTIREKLAERFNLKYGNGTPFATELNLDMYYNDQSHLSPEERDKLNFDDPNNWTKKEATRDMKELAQGRTIYQPVYDFATHTRVIGKFKEINPKKAILAESIFGFEIADEDKGEVLIFVNTPIQRERNPATNICLERRIDRDMSTRERTKESVLAQWPSVYESWYSLIMPGVTRVMQNRNVHVIDWSHPKEKNDHYADQLFEKVSAAYKEHAAKYAAAIENFRK